MMLLDSAVKCNHLHIILHFLHSAERMIEQDRVELTAVPC